ncbi:MAG TPA: DUF1800 domain-containing protein [Burkholderiales bacterium]|nr:DUF1800 domain-containing protein [Burkholderiales bacterium]HUK05353.1 DUF1800 domain-containing protein [Burkholderiales bacterium]
MRALAIVCGLTVCASALAQAPAEAELRFLNRIAYGATTRDLEDYRALGRDAYLRRQLAFHGDEGLPREALAAIAALPVSRLRPEDLAEKVIAARRAARFKSADEKREAAKQLRREFAQLDLQVFERRTLRALYSPYPLQEMMTWFWFNHFNVFQNKKQVRFLLADYEESAIRPHVLGRFRDLLQAVLMHPAMTVYLDNAENVKGKINENYARELMELHTLGVDGGYTQADVEALARILTGAGIYAPSGRFAFVPERHDTDPKVFLGQSFSGFGGFSEIERALDMLCKHPSTAKFVSRKLAVYFLADDPPAEVVEQMAATFRKTDGDIARTLATLFASPQFSDPQLAGKKFKDPVQYVYSSIRLLYPADVLKNARPLAGALVQLGEPVYGHQTPEGYGMKARDWTSSDQLAKRFQLARGFVGARARLFVTAAAIDAGIDEGELRRVRQAHPIARARIEPLVAPLLSPKTREALARAEDPQEWAALLLASPEFMYR